MRERRGICPTCHRISAVTAKDRVRMHLVPKDQDSSRSRANCPGTGQPPLSVAIMPSVDSQREWPAEVRGLADAYNRLHQQLCHRGSFCSEHIEGYTLAGCIQDGWPDPDLNAPRVYRGSAPSPRPDLQCPCFYPELDPEDSDGVRCMCGHAMDEHDDYGDCTIMFEKGVL